MGWEPKEEDMPLDPSMLSIEAQQALILLNSLPDIWEGMGGTWLGKDYSGLSAIIDIYEIDSKKEVFELLKVAESELGKYYAQKRKEQESMSKTKRAK
jgi:hypothetical protein